jgi:hypothetical protein
MLEVYGADLKARTPEKQSALAKKLFAVSAETKDAAQRYVTLTRARDLASQAGDVGTALGAMQALDDSFVLSLKNDLDPAFRKLAKLVQPGPDLGRLYVMIDGTIGSLIASDQFEDAERMGALLLQVSKRSADVILVKRATARTAQIKKASSDSRELRPTFVTLQSDPANAPANLKAGRFVCFTKGKWQEGLPMLAKGNDPATQAAAALDLTNPQDAAGRAAVGDAWWAVAEKDSANRAAIHARAAFWYAAASKDLEGLAKAKVEKRLAEVRADEPADPKALVDVDTRKRLQELVGKWRVNYVNGIWTEYQIWPDGTITVLASSHRDAGPRLTPRFFDGWFWMDIASLNKFEQFRLEDGKITVHHWQQAEPMPNPPKAPGYYLVGTGSRIP